MTYHRLENRRLLYIMKLENRKLEMQCCKSSSSKKETHEFRVHVSKSFLMAPFCSSSSSSPVTVKLSRWLMNMDNGGDDAGRDDGPFTQSAAKSCFTWKPHFLESFVQKIVRSVRRRSRENRKLRFSVFSAAVMLGWRLLLACLLMRRIQAEGLRDKIPCIENDKFYRNPNRDPAHVWSQTECAKYYYCVEAEVFEFECSTGLTFDINRQICDFKTNVGNCDVTAEETTPKPLLNTEEPICPKGENACADGTCIPTSLFCDGHPGTWISVLLFSFYVRRVVRLA